MSNAVREGGETSSAGGDARAATLDVSAEELQELARLFNDLAAAYIGEPEALPVFPETSSEQVTKLFQRELPAEPVGLEALARGCAEVLRHSRQNGHPRMFGYVASPAAPAGAYATLLASALNSNVTSWRSAPSATAVEKTVVRWLAEMIRYARAGVNEACGGLLTSGGSMANLNALFVAHRSKAREFAKSDGAPDASSDPSRAGLWNAGAPMTVYASDQVHLSIPKAADVLGLGRDNVRVVPSDSDFRIDVRALRELIDSDAERGLRPFCVVASAGTVSTGAVDPLVEVARVARERSLWFHVDGAYGALAASVETKRALFDGLDEADSVSLDPHKWLYTPLDCGCLLYREPGRAREAFAGTEEGYIKIFEQTEEEAHAFWDYGVELSRPFRALKVWAILSYYGARRVSASIEEDCAMAEYMAAQVEAAEDLELLAPVALGICCFRYAPASLRDELEKSDGDERERLNARLDELNARVMRRVQRGGEAYVSNAVLRGRFALRASITNFRTTRRDVDLTLDAVRRAASEIERNN
ncbi:MAG TPA: pyridoxal-dependent decarboxylase [Pyrinomonadaceae bacterium]|jgi:glutamate/tyrosine decarboxylase-like PLP-dependent enzyme|nr:pyridoxal-dependent decarboxylase [Pyrinomonadaceae bacterium]